MVRAASPWWWLIAALALALLLHLLAPVLMPFVLSAVLAYMGDPLADRLEARGMGRGAAVTLVFCIFTLVGLGLVLMTLPLLFEQLQLLSARLRELFVWLLETGLPEARRYLGLPAQESTVDSAKKVLSENWGTAGGLLMMVWQKVSSSGMAMLAWLANITLVPVVTFYLLRDWDVMMARLRGLLPRRIEARTVTIVEECDDILGAFALGQLMVMSCLGVVYSIGLWLVGLELALVLGLAAGLASIVPYLGFIFGISAAGLAAFFQFDGWLPLLGVAAVFGVGQLLESLYLTPTLVGDKIGLHPVLVIFAIMAGGQLFGFLGVLLALPAAAVIKVMISHLHEFYRRSDLYGGTSSDDGNAGLAAPESNE
ncbi:AI-2E family transporter [Spongiibacter taiwanensis]|uniref:AI-2E family transporter n=1 Tax=Spongiibacter taiwanensis TaxID=1748242 RepID=UPI0020364CDE|nr:AI-2E family transporter [Spongiibacter taiwanensis]USA43927.1 AI-2E family transporter [Spongiibacter taiwanensis]